MRIQAPTNVAATAPPPIYHPQALPRATPSPPAHLPLTQLPHTHLRRTPPPQPAAHPPALKPPPTPAPAPHHPPHHPQPPPPEFCFRRRWAPPLRPLPHPTASPPPRAACTISTWSSGRAGWWAWPGHRVLASPPCCRLSSGKCRGWAEEWWCGDGWRTVRRSRGSRTCRCGVTFYLESHGIPGGTPR